MSENQIFLRARRGSITWVIAIKLNDALGPGLGSWS